MLTRLDNKTALNLDAVASIRFSGDYDELAATVTYSTPVPPETFTGEAARSLSEMVGGDPPPQSGTPHNVPPNNGPHEGRAGESRAIPFQPVPFRRGFARTKGWYYLKAADGHGYFAAFVNAKGSCSMRTFDAETRRFLGKEYRSGNYQEQFAEFIQDATELSVASQPNLERDCKERLPEAVFSHLMKQVE